MQLKAICVLSVLMTRLCLADSYAARDVDFVRRAGWTRQVIAITARGEEIVRVSLEPSGAVTDTNAVGNLVTLLKLKRAIAHRAGGTLDILVSDLAGPKVSADRLASAVQPGGRHDGAGVILPTGTSIQLKASHQPATFATSQRDLLDAAISVGEETLTFAWNLDADAPTMLGAMREGWRTLERTGYYFSPITRWGDDTESARVAFATPPFARREVARQGIENLMRSQLPKEGLDLKCPSCRDGKARLVVGESGTLLVSE
jgi:hypothetical protein